MKQLLILSGKGGTGKTTTAAAFISFSNARAIADCDVDAPNLHIVKKIAAKPKEKAFIGSQKAHIDEKLCVGCKKCLEHCRFNAIDFIDNKCQINEFACEGCGVCEYVCPQKAAYLEDDIAGEQELYLGDTVFSTAKLKMGRGNSGKLVTSVKKDMLFNAHEDTSLAIIDGSPGIGCPVIASVSGIDLALIVAEPSLSGISDLERLIKTATVLHTPVAVCINKFNSSLENSEKIEQFCKEHQIPFLGKIPYDKAASKAINSSMSIAQIDCPARSALLEVYNKVLKLLNI